MGDHGDDMFDDDLEAESCLVCEKHGILYSPRWGCPKCEDGEPALAAPKSRKPVTRKPARSEGGEGT